MAKQIALAKKLLKSIHIDDVRESIVECVIEYFQLCVLRLGDIISVYVCKLHTYTGKLMFTRQY